ncbi:MAG: undecaprenyl/decaprenyl-phosphate alpha-N-acetylglucosaminyl 1-phosphate transferase [Betaproteobacteria bacterium]|nr:undecaprenyl/decaprenyl-phosphate alpha-N-acetylglucosaminyl 1-phosphate transferase [Betaproteobacteria bacterium]
MNEARIVLATASMAAFAAIATWVLARLAPTLGLVDHPGGRKDHAAPIPVVGGIALVLTLLCAELVVGDSIVPPSFLGAAAILVVVSIWDDWKELHHIPRFAAQILAVLAMVYGAGVELRSVGDLLGWRPIGLSVLSIPTTVFAVVGVINAVNMIDGMDGLAGSTSLVSFAWYGVAATLSGDTGLAGLAWILCGGLTGFLLFNVRAPWQPQARVFLGDAGSTLLGFALAWFAVDLSQGAGSTMSPIAALWVVLLPLADTVSLMARRRSRGKSPFHPDREHIHHFLLAHGFSVNGALGLLVGASALFGAVGVLGWRAGVPETVLFWVFFFSFFAYHYAIKRAWARLNSGAMAIGSSTEARES